MPRRGSHYPDSDGCGYSLSRVPVFPVFYLFGLNTKIGLLDASFPLADVWCRFSGGNSGKGVACLARWPRSTGTSNREALGIGVLMNARGLMELIIINVGLQRGIISERIVRCPRDYGGHYYSYGLPDFWNASWVQGSNPKPTLMSSDFLL